jgi:hypothetical protein
MRLPFFKNKLKIENYLVLLLNDEKITAVIFEERIGKISIIAKREQVIATILDETPIDELIEQIDNTISRTEETLPADVQVHNTIFSVKDSWVLEKKIRKDILVKLKQICEHLSLTPLGFIVLSEAISHHLHSEEGVPISALLTEVGKKVVTVSLFRGGKLIETKQQPINDTPMQSADTILKSFINAEVLPSRVILLNTGEVNDKKANDVLLQQFISYQWSKGLPFLHIPQISILPHWFDALAIVAGAASQLGFSLTDLSQEVEPIVDKIHDNVIAKENTKETIERKDDIDSDNSTENIPKDTEAANNFGFILDQDISALQILPHIKDEETDLFNHQKLSSKPDEKKVTGKHNTSSFVILFGRIKNMTSAFLQTKKYLFIIPVAVIIFIGLILLYIFKEQATVTIFVTPKAISETQKVIFTVNQANDFSQNIIAAKETSITLDGSVTTEATGKKEIGDKAKGSIIIYNSGTKSSKLAQGTVLTSDKGLDYTIDTEINVASASGDIFTGIKSGTTQAAVTAKQIGTDYNLPSGTKFSIEDSNEIAAKNDTAFSGGSKKSVTVVTKADKIKLEDALLKSLEQKAREQLQKKVGNDQVLLSDFKSNELSKETLDKNIDDQAKTVTLTGTVIFSAFSYGKQDITKYTSFVLLSHYTKEKVSQSKINVKLSGQKLIDDGKISAVLQINAGLLPIIDANTIAYSITGKNFAEVKKYGKSISKQVTDVEINLTPNIPFLPRNLPRIAKNITVAVKIPE